MPRPTRAVPKPAPLDTPASLPHDAFCKVLLRQQRVLLALLEERLPASIQKSLRLETARVINSNLVSDRLKQAHGDVVVQVRTKSGGWRLRFVLVEYKSHPDPDVALRLLEYRVLVYASHDKELERVVSEATPKNKNMFVSIADHFWNEGRVEGERKGLTEGERRELIDANAEG